MSTKTTITKSKAGHYWLRVRSLAMPDIFVGDAFSTKKQAQEAIPEYIESCLGAVRVETLRLKINSIPTDDQFMDAMNPCSK